MKRKVICYLALFPGLSCFYLSFAFTIIHTSGGPFLVDLPIPCIIVNAKGRSKTGEAWG